MDVTCQLLVVTWYFMVVIWQIMAVTWSKRAFSLKFLRIWLKKAVFDEFFLKLSESGFKGLKDCWILVRLRCVVIPCYCMFSEKIDQTLSQRLLI